MHDKRSVLFVCWGNICRSPAAEGVMRHLVVERDLDDRIEIDSAGTIDAHQGESPDARMRRAASERGYILEGRSRPVVPEDFDRFDLVVAMDRSNLVDLESMVGGPHEHVLLLSHFLPDGGPVDVPDPYYGGGRGFEIALDMLTSACPVILDRLIEG